MLYNRLKDPSYNSLGDLQYNDLRVKKTYPLYQRLAGARPILLNQTKEVIAVLENVMDVHLNQELNSTDILEFTIPFDDPNVEFIVNENYLVIVDREYIIRKIGKTRGQDGRKFISVYAEASWYDLQFADPIPFIQWSDVSVDVPMRELLSGTGWKVGKIDVSLRRSYSISSGLTNRLKALREVSELWGGILFFHALSREVDLIAHQFNDPGIAIIHRKNMKKLKAEYDTQDLVTRLYPYGKNDLTIADANNGLDYVENYQYTKQIRVRSFKDNRFENAYHLKEKALEILDTLSMPRASYVISAADLSNLSGLSHEAFKLGDLVKVYDEELGVDLKTQIVKWKYHMLEPWQTELELASVQPGLQDLLKSVADTAIGLQSEDTLKQRDLMDLMVFNYVLNSRAEEGDAYWVNNGWTIDAMQGYSSNTSFRCQGELSTEKTLSQIIRPAHRNAYTFSLRVAAQDIIKGPNGKVGVEILIAYKDGTTETQFLSLA
jgi:phage minor structural protein